jgi:hypothetical protein
MVGPSEVSPSKDRWNGSFSSRATVTEDSNGNAKHHTGEKVIKRVVSSQNNMYIDQLSTESVKYR